MVESQGLFYLQPAQKNNWEEKQLLIPPEKKVLHVSLGKELKVIKELIYLDQLQEK